MDDWKNELPLELATEKITGAEIHTFPSNGEGLVAGDSVADFETAEKAPLANKTTKKK